MYPTKSLEKSIVLMSHMRLLTVFMVAVTAFILAITAPELWANDEDDGDGKPFAEANIFFELNNTDGDLGIHALIDGEPWKRLEIEDPRERGMLDIRVKGRLRRQGLTEIFFESAEPSFESDDPSEVTLSPARFFRRFREGIYEIEGETLKGEELESEVLLTHVMPAPADGITLSGAPVNLEDVECDDEDTVPSVSGPVTISWEPVTMSHPDSESGGAAVQPPVGVTIINYQVVVEVVVDVNGEEFASVLSIILPPAVTSVTIPAEFLAQGDEFKYEILAREESYNQTAVESCFVLE